MTKKSRWEGWTVEQREKAIALAIDDKKSGRVRTLRQAADKYDVPKSTLEDQSKGREERHIAHEHQQALGPSEEAEVVLFCDKMEQRFLPVRVVHVVGCAEQILKNRLGTNDAYLGENWGHRFLQRHPELQLTTSKRIDERRVMAKNPTYVMEFYVIVSNVIKNLSIDASRLFDMDEKGFLLGITGKEKVVIMRRDRRDGYAGGAKDYGNRETVTSIDCICADGSVLPPMIIMKGKNVMEKWSRESPLPPETKWACSPNGWTDNELGIEYIQAFDQWTKHKAPNGEWRCLILDGHASHVSYGFLQYAHQAHIIVVGLPSHTTDFLQPLDRVIFRALQRFYSEAVRNRMQKMLAVTKGNFSQLLHEAREKAYTEKNILSAFEATGLSPFNPYRTTVMQTFRARAQTAHMVVDKPTSTPSSMAPQYNDRQEVIERCRDLISDTEASVEELKKGLLDMISVTEGAEARIVLLESERDQYQKANQEKQSKKARGGRVGHARVYSQAEIEDIRQKEQARAEAVLARGRGRGRGRGGRNTGRKSLHESSDEGEVD